MIVEERTDILIKELNKNSGKAFDELYRQYSPKLYNFSLSLMSDEVEAEEIVQEVFVKIWEKRQSVTINGSFESYLFTIAKNTFLNKLRRTETHRAFINYEKGDAEPSAELDHEVEYNELTTIYQRAIDRLSPRRKEIFNFSYKEALSNDEIADKLGISSKAVRNQKNMAVMEIKKYISQLGFEGVLILALFFNV